MPVSTDAGNYAGPNAGPTSPPSSFSSPTTSTLLILRETLRY